MRVFLGHRGYFSSSVLIGGCCVFTEVDCRCSCIQFSLGPCGMSIQSSSPQLSSPGFAISARICPCLTFPNTISGTASDKHFKVV